MIQAMIFDLDGTLVQTEKLKALSYAKAAIDLCPHAITEGEVIEVFKTFVGLPRREVAEGLVDRFALEPKAIARMEEFGVSAPWQAFVQVRLSHYERMLADPELIRSNRWPHTLAVLEQARQDLLPVGLATMSRCRQARRVLEILDLESSFNFIATRDDVEHGKPDPEIYLLVSAELGVRPEECLVLEDSASGVRAALTTGMSCIAITTPFSRQGVHNLGLLEERWIVDDPGQVAHAVRRMLDERKLEPK